MVPTRTTLPPNMKTLPFLMFFFLPLFACDTSEIAIKSAAKSVPAMQATGAPTPAAAPRAKPPRRETSTPRPAYLFM